MPPLILSHDVDPLIQRVMNEILRRLDQHNLYRSRVHDIPVTLSDIEYSAELITRSVLGHAAIALRYESHRMGDVARDARNGVLPANGMTAEQCLEQATAYGRAPGGRCGRRRGTTSWPRARRSRQRITRGPSGTRSARANLRSWAWSSSLTRP